MDKMIMDLTPNMYDSPAINIEEIDSMTVISIEDLDPSQTIGDDGEIPEENDDMVSQYEEDEMTEDDEDYIEENPELTSFESDEEDSEEEFDDTGMDEDFYEDLNEDSEE